MAYQVKNTTTWYPTVKKGGGLIWEQATMRWVDAVFTWAEASSTSWSAGTKNTTTLFTAQTKS